MPSIPLIYCNRTESSGHSLNQPLTELLQSLDFETMNRTPQSTSPVTTVSTAHARQPATDSSVPRAVSFSSCVGRTAFSWVWTIVLDTDGCFVDPSDGRTSSILSSSMLLMMTHLLLLVKTKYRYYSYGPIRPELNVYTKSAN